MQITEPGTAPEPAALTVETGAPSSSGDGEDEAAATPLAAAILETRRPLLLRGAIAAATVRDLYAYFQLTKRPSPPLVPGFRENTVSNEAGANELGAPTTPGRLFRGNTAGQLRVDAPPSAADAAAPLLPEGVAVKKSIAFATSKGLRTPMHSDAEDGLLLHVAGSKRVLIAGPAGANVETALRLGRRNGTHLDVFGAVPDAAAKLGAAPADVASVELHPGDALYIPRRWLHDVESRTATLSIALRLDLPAHLDF